MSSLQTVGGLLLHQVSSSSASTSVVSRAASAAAACCSSTSTSLCPSAAAVPHFLSASLRKSSSSSCSSLSFLKSGAELGSFLSVSPAGGRGDVMAKSWLSKLGFGGRAGAQMDPNSPALGPDDDKPAAGQQFATFGAGCFWGPELAFQRVPGVTKTEVGYTQGYLHNPTYGDVCDGDTGHVEVVRVQFNPTESSFEKLLDAFWARHDPTTLNRQGGDVGTQYRSGIYYYTPEEEKAAKESLEAHQAKVNKKIVTEILPAKKFYRAEEYHQQYLSKGGRFGFRQSPEKGCNDPIRCYG